MDEMDVRRLQSALDFVESARGNLEPAYRKEDFPTGDVDGALLAAAGLIRSILETEESEPITIVRAEQTCFGCPSQWDAWDADGNQYYLRYRWGCGTFMLKARMTGGELAWMVYGEEVSSFETDDHMDGVISLADFAEKAGIRLGGAL